VSITSSGRSAEFADGIVIGMGVGRQVAHRDVLVGQRFDPATRKSARGVAVDEQAEHHGRRILRLSGSPFVGLGEAQVQSRNGIHDEMHHVIRTNPFTQIGR